jgi:hypothetical protein
MISHYASYVLWLSQMPSGCLNTRMRVASLELALSFLLVCLLCLFVALLLC